MIIHFGIAVDNKEGGPEGKPVAVWKYDDPTATVLAWCSTTEEGIREASRLCEGRDREYQRAWRKVWKDVGVIK
jgi:hypothetical protein